MKRSRLLSHLLSHRLSHRLSLRRLAPALMLLATLVSAGCSTSLTNMTSPKALGQGEVQMAVHFQGSVHSNVIDKTLVAGEQAIDDIQNSPADEPMSVETFRAYINGAVAWMLFQPGIATEFMARIGLYDDFLEGLDFGLRYNSSVIKGDLKLQLWEDASEVWALALQAGYGHHLSFVDEIFEYVSLTEWSRYDLDLGLSVGLELGDIVRAWVSPRLIASQVSVDRVELPAFVESRLPAEIREHDPHQLFQDEWMIYTGGSLGMMLGYKYVFATMELNVFHLSFEPRIVDEPQDFDSMVLAPAAGFTIIW